MGVEWFATVKHARPILSEARQVHDLGDARRGELRQLGELRQGLDRAGVEQFLEVVGKCQGAGRRVSHARATAALVLLATAARARLVAARRGLATLGHGPERVPRVIVELGQDRVGMEREVHRGQHLGGQI